MHVQNVPWRSWDKFSSHSPVCPRSFLILSFYLFFLSPRCSPSMSCYNQILCAFLIFLKCATRPSYLRTIFILYSDLCLCLPCAKILLSDMIWFKWRTSHVIWWTVLIPLCTEKINMEEGIPKTTVTKGTDVAREVRLRHCVHWTAAMALQSHMGK